MRMCQDLRVLNAIRDYQIGIPLTFTQYPLWDGHTSGDPGLGAGSGPDRSSAVWGFGALLGQPPCRGSETGWRELQSRLAADWPRRVWAPAVPQAPWQGSVAETSTLITPRRAGLCCLQS